MACCLCARCICASSPSCTPPLRRDGFGIVSPPALSILHPLDLPAGPITHAGAWQSMAGMALAITYPAGNGIKEMGLPREAKSSWHLRSTGTESVRPYLIVCRARTGRHLGHPGGHPDGYPDGHSRDQPACSISWSRVALLLTSSLATPPTLHLPGLSFLS